MQAKKHNVILYILIVVGLISALFINLQRHNVEKVNRQVEIMMDYEDLVKLASLSGKSVQATLADFKQAGVTTLNVYDTNLEKLSQNGIVSVLTNSQVMDAKRLGTVNLPWAETLTAAELGQVGVYVIGQPGIYWTELQEDVAQRFAAHRVVASGNQPVIFIPGDIKLVMEKHLGIPTAEMKYVIERGFLLTVRPMNYEKVTEQNIKHFFARIDKAQVPVTGIHFTSLQSFGAKAQIGNVAQELQKRNITLAMAESFVQLQFAEMLSLEDYPPLMNYNVARLYVIDKRERGKIKIEEAIRRFALTDEERNIRINFLHCFEEPEADKTLYKTNLDYVQAVTKSVEQRGFTLGRAGVFAPYFPSKLYVLPVIWGAAAAVVLYLSLLFNNAKFDHKKQILLVLALAALFSLPIISSGGKSVRQLVAFISAAVFPALSMIYIIGLWDQNTAQGSQKSFAGVLFTAAWQLTLAVFASLIGGMYLSAVLADVRFFLEMDIYRGVKLTFLMPIVLVALYYVARYNVFGRHNEDLGLLKQLKGFLKTKITMEVLAIVGLLGFVAWVFIGRSGHTQGVPVPGIEIKMRLFLEEVMYARPREKEFMIGHVGFFLAALAHFRNYPRLICLAFVAVATIGQGSLVQTFAHMRTPVIMSVIRALDGLALGIVVAVAVTVLFNFLYPYLRKFESELHVDE